MRDRQWHPTAPVLKYDKSSFSFLIAMGRQLELALELEQDGSAPDFVIDALGVLQNALEGIPGPAVDHEDAGGEPDDGSAADIHPASGLPDEVASGDAGTRRSRGAVVSPLGQLSAQDMKPIRLQSIAPKGSPVAKKPKPGARPPKRAKARGTRKK